MAIDIIYLRTSTDEQSPENQLEDVKKIASKDARVITETQSAWKDNNRPKFNLIISKIKKREIKNIYVWDLDRLYRNRKKTMDFFQLCNLYKCKIHSYRQEWLRTFNSITPPFDEIMHDLLLNIMSWLSEEESNKRSDRVKASIKYIEGVAYSKKGNKWGRKKISKKTVDEVLKLHKAGVSIRNISKQVKTWDSSRNEKSLSKSAVHKIIKENTI